MDEGRRYFRLGVFVVITLFAMAVILFILGGRSLFEDSYVFETYFDGSVAGLDVGAPVRFRGVPAGSVSEILTSSVEYEENVPIGQRRQYIVVRATIKGSDKLVAQLEREVPDAVAKGLRAQTQLAGITGQQFLALDILDPKTHPGLPYDWQPAYPVVPSAPSSTAQILASAQDLIANLGQADIPGLVENVNRLVVNLDDKISKVPVADMSAEVSDLLRTAQETLEHIDRVFAAGGALDDSLGNIDSASARIDELVSDPAIKEALETAADLSSRLDSVVADSQYDIRGIVRDLRATAANLRALSEAFKNYPAGALLGGPPEEVEIPESEQ